jgi:hypothetical protein
MEGEEDRKTADEVRRQLDAWEARIRRMEANFQFLAGEASQLDVAAESMAKAIDSSYDTIEAVVSELEKAVSSEGGHPGGDIEREAAAILGQLQTLDRLCALTADLDALIAAAGGPADASGAARPDAHEEEEEEEPEPIRETQPPAADAPPPEPRSLPWTARPAVVGPLAGSLVVVLICLFVWFGINH